VDIPAIQTAVILASSGNRASSFSAGANFASSPWQGTRHLFDMIVMPQNCRPETWEVERNLLRKELRDSWSLPTWLNVEKPEGNCSETIRITGLVSLSKIDVTVSTAHHGSCKQTDKSDLQKAVSRSEFSR